MFAEQAFQQVNSRAKATVRGQVPRKTKPRRENLVLEAVLGARVDAAAPTSSVSALPATTVPTSFAVTWSGADDIGGSGIATFDLYVSDNGGEFISWLASTTQTSATYDGVAGHTYAFYSIARDGTGNAEPVPAAPDAFIQVVGWYTASAGAVFAFDGPPGARNLTVTSGTVTCLADAQDFEPELNIEVAPGAHLVLQAGQHVKGLSVGGEVVVAAGNDKVLVTQSLLVANEGRLNLRDNALIVLDTQKTSLGSWDGSAYTGVTGMIASAYNFGSWDQPGIMTSMPDAGPTIGTTTLAVATADQILFIGSTESGTFAGETVIGSSIIVMYTYAGDVNFDGLVDAADYGIIDNYYQFPGTTGYANGDFNYDGVIDAGDYGIIDNTYQLQGPRWHRHRRPPMSRPLIDRRCHSGTPMPSILVERMVTRTRRLRKRRWRRRSAREEMHAQQSR